jgi:Nucleotide-diphospho-sugar transferase
MVVISRRLFAVGLVVVVCGTWANLRASFSQTVVEKHHDKRSSSGAPLILPSSSSSWSSSPSWNGTIDPIPQLDIQTMAAVSVSNSTNNNNKTQSTGIIRTKIVGFADENYKEYAVTWYRRLEALGYTEQVIVAVDQATVDFLQQYPTLIRFEQLAYPPCLSAHAKDTRKYRREIFARRWKYLFDQLSTGHHVLLTDVDNVFSRYLPLHDLEGSDFDVYHAYSTSYPERVFWDMGFTVCGGMGWYRASQKVRQFVGTLLNKCNCWTTVDCNCYCDDQVVLNELLWKGKHSVKWDTRKQTTGGGAEEDWTKKPAALNDWKWTSIEGVSSKTQHKIKIWDRNVAYRAPMPESCPKDNWVSMPLYVNRSTVAKEWDQLCGSSLPH